MKKNKKVILSHNTSFKAHEALRIKHRILKLSDTVSSASNVYSGLEFEFKNEGFLEFVCKPYDIFVPRLNMRGNNNYLRSHCMMLSDVEHKKKAQSQKGYPMSKENLVLAYKISNNLAIVSPELLFLQLVQSYGPIYALQAGMEMCGSYCINPRNSNLVSDVDAITSAEKIQAFLDTLSASTRYIKSIRIAKRFAKYLRDGSASPQETKLYLKLALPKCDGGLGLSNLLFNYPVMLPMDARNLTKRQIFYCDLANPVAKVAIEYDSKEFHSKYDNVSADRAKKETLQGLGWKVFTFTAQEVGNLETFNEKARQIALALGKRAGKTVVRYAVKQKELFEVLKK